ncbi:MAG: hypothetical protein ABII02_03540 [Candidatus Magasanikbacteria bacterium]
MRGKSEDIIKHIKLVMGQYKVSAADMEIRHKEEIAKRVWINSNHITEEEKIKLIEHELSKLENGIY